MIKSFSSTLESGLELVLPLNDLSTTGLKVVNVEGLGPPRALINASGGASFDGERVSGLKVDSRTITLTLGIEGGGSIEEASRMNLYRYFPIKQKIVFGVSTDTRDASIEGYVESNELRAFSRVENTTITIFCPSVYFTSQKVVEEVFYGTIPLFEFPFSNESLTDPLIMFGNNLAIVDKTVEYLGDVATGVIFNFTVNGPVGTIGIHNHTVNESMEIDESAITTITGAPLQAGDLIVVDTRVGHKTVTLQRDGIVHNILNALNLFSQFIQLYPGFNSIVYTATSGIEDLGMVMDFYPLYEGV